MKASPAPVSRTIVETRYWTLSGNNLRKGLQSLHLSASRMHILFHSVMSYQQVALRAPLPIAESKLLTILDDWYLTDLFSNSHGTFAPYHSLDGWNLDFLTDAILSIHSALS